MANRFYVTDNGADSTVTDSGSGVIVFTGAYERAVGQAAELNRQASDAYNQTTTVKPTGASNEDSGGTPNERISTSMGSTNESEGQTAQSLNTDGTKKENNLPPGGTNSGNTSYPASTRPNKRQFNPLSKFSSVTYRISLYAITPDAYNNFYVQGKWITKNLELIVQSAGINDTADAPRNEFFKLDYYIDNLEITTKTNAKETQTSGNQSDFKFQIFEPYGLTFPTRLTQAEVKLQQKANIKRDIKHQIQALNSPFLLVVRFYGYDANGNLVTESVDKGTDTNFTKTDTNAAFERAFPIYITKFGFKLDNKVTVYDIQAKLINEQAGLGIKRGIFKTGKTVTADTVENALYNGKDGLFDQLNQEQKELASKIDNKENSEKQSIADVYKIVFQEGSGINDASLVAKGNFVKEYAPVANVTDINQVNVRTAATKGTIVEKNKRTIKIAEGTPVLTAIDQVIKQSSYVTDAMTVVDVEEVEPTQDGETTYSKQKAVQLYWYNVRPQVKIIGFDTKRQDFAYEVTYVVQRYRTPYVRSLVLNDSTSYYGPYKIYKYWYTGQNSEVLSYDIQYNLLYLNMASISSEVSNTSTTDTTPNTPLGAQAGDPTNKLAGSSELTNSIVTNLYSPGDKLKAQIKILGDPDFLMPAEAGSIEETLKTWYGPDYSINASSGQVYIEIGFQQVEDYGDNTGLLSPNNNIKFWDYPPDIEKQAEGRMIYMVVQVISRFSRGTFTQELKTVLPEFPTKKAAENSGATQREQPNTSSETAREPAQQRQQATSATGSMNATRPAVQSDVRKIDNTVTATTNSTSALPGTTSSANEDRYSDPMGTTDAAAIAESAGKERENSTGAGFLSRIFGTGNTGRGAQRTYDTTNRTRGM
jgi:hypothetical protein